MASNREQAPVIPVYLDNLWGSIFSFSGGRFFRKWPKFGRRTVVVCFGPPIERPLSVFAARQAIVLAGVSAFEARPPKDQNQFPETIDLEKPHLRHPTLGLLTASTANFNNGVIRQIGEKPGTVGQAVPGVALRVVDAEGLPLPAETEGQLQARIAGHPGWQDVGRLARMDREGFVFLIDAEDVV